MGKSAFTIEYKRAELAAQGKLLELKQLYAAKYPEIPDLNSAKFWNERLEVRLPLSEQDGITRNRTRIVAEFLPESVQRVLDIGAGAGWVEELLEKRNIELYGTDISDKTIKNLKKRFRGTFWIESIYDLNSKKGLYDGVLLLEVLEHIPPSKTFKVLQKISNILKPNGYFIVSVPTNEGLDTMADNPNGHVRMYTVPLISAELELAGFKILRLKTLYAFKNFYLLKQLLAALWRNRWKPNNIIILAQRI